MSTNPEPVQAQPAPRGGGNVGCLPAIGVVVLILGYAFVRTYLFEKRGVPDDVVADAIRVRMGSDPSVGRALCGPATESFAIQRIEGVVTQGDVRRGSGAATIVGTRSDSVGASAPCRGRVRFQYYSDRVGNDQVVQVYEIVPDGA